MKVRGLVGFQPGRHGTHGNHKRTITDEHINYLLDHTNQAGAGITLKWMSELLQMNDVNVTEGGLHNAMSRLRI